MRRWKRDIAISAPVFPAETVTSGLALFHRIDGKPHGGGLAAAPQRLARLFLPADRDVGVDDLRGGLQRGVAVELGLDLGAVPDQQEFDLAMPLERDGGSWNDHDGAGVAPHGVKRDTNLAWHKSPGNLVWCGLERAGPQSGFAIHVHGGRPSATRTRTGPRQ
ncbi:hypothetical protein ACVWWR_007749 [Bradyrhizobium sp. LM3.2]